MGKIKFFIDFDGTLFDRSRFVRDLFLIIKGFGFTDKELEDSYRAVYHHGYDGVWAQLSYLHRNVRAVDIKNASSKINEILKNTDKYLYDEALPFLKSINRRKYHVELLTVGCIRFQRLKVKNSGITKLFDRNNFTTLPKAKALSRCVGKEDVFILIDDKEKELEKVSEKFKNALVIRAQDGKLLSYSDPVSR